MQSFKKSSIAFPRLFNVILFAVGKADNSDAATKLAISSSRAACELTIIPALALVFEAGNYICVIVVYF